VADYLILISEGRVQVAGEVDDLLARHRVLTGPAAQAGRYAERLSVVHATGGGAQAHLQVIPALIGAFVAAPLLARELETGTFRYAWTQGFGRSRWTVAKLVPLAVAVTVAAGAFSVLVSWYIQPLWGAGDDNGPLYPTIFDLRGAAFAAWTLAASAIGAPGRRPDPPGHSRDVRHLRVVCRARLRDRCVPARALRGAADQH
jgi:hypothetical protein